jgi:S1-C subfamily serine protease
VRGVIRQFMLWAAVVSTVLALACSSSVPATPTPLAGSSLAGKEAVRQGEECAPESNPVALVLPALVRVETVPDARGSYSAGTGIVIDRGWLLTNQHVIDGAVDGIVRTFYGDGHQAPGKVVASDAGLDLALVQSDTGDLQSVNWGDEGRLQPGAVLFAVGFARGALLPSKSQGRYVQTIVDRSSGQAFIESDVPLEHGDSGGPLLNRCGQVIGINTARISGAGRQYAGLSIPGFGARSWSTRNRPQ